MKNVLKKVIATMLCLCLLAGPKAYACDFENVENMPAVFSTLIDFAERFISVFIGSTNEKSDVEYTMEQGEIFEAKKYFSDSHASTVVKTDDGKLISAWFAGTEEGDADVRIWYSTHNGEEWSEPKQLATYDEVAHWNPVLMNCDGYIRLFFKVGMEIPNWVTKYVDTYDGGETWTEPKELVAGDTSGGRGPVKNKCLVTSTGLIIAPSSSEQGSWRAFFDISEDGGLTWEKTNFVIAKDFQGNEVGMIQPTLWEDENGDIHAMFRTKAGRIYRSDSTDGGYTWSEAYATELMNNNSGIDCVTTDNGWLWLAYTPVGMEVRNRLILSVSKDNGETWQDVAVLEESINLFAEYSYPTIIADGNNLYITYTYNRETIKYAFVEVQY